jgi:uncharacterized membrane protein
MSDLIVVVFDDAEEAGKVRASLKSVEHEGKLSLDDSAVVVKDEKGKIHVKNQVDRGVKIGAVTGGLIGILLASLFFPVAGLIVGAVAGGLIGKSAGLGVSKSFVGMRTRLLPSPPYGRTKARFCKPPWPRKMRKPYAGL